MATVAMFESLVVDENANPIDTTWVGSDVCYVINDGDFRRHIDAASVDRQVLEFFKGQIDAHRDIAVKGILQMMGKDDIFSKTAVEYSIDRMDEAVGQPVPPEARQYLKDMGFRIVIDFHGEVVDVRLPENELGDF